MLATLKKEKKKQAPETLPGGDVTCGACGYVRQLSDNNPDWQCPACGSAYVKVNRLKHKKSIVEKNWRARTSIFENPKLRKLSGKRTGPKSRRDFLQEHLLC